MSQFGPVIWVPSAVVSNPTDGTVLCDSGALSRGFWLFGVSGETDVSIVFDLKAVTTLGKLLARRRPAAGDIDILVPNQVEMPQNEHVQVLIVGAPAATVQLTLFGILSG